MIVTLPLLTQNIQDKPQVATTDGTHDTNLLVKITQNFLKLTTPIKKVTMLTTIRRNGLEMHVVASHADYIYFLQHALGKNDL